MADKVEKRHKIPPDLRFAEIVNKQKKLKPQTAAAYQLNPWLVCFKQQQKMEQFLAKSRKHPAKILLIFYLARKISDVICYAATSIFNF